MMADPQLLVHYNGDADQWHIVIGMYQIGLGSAAYILFHSIIILLNIVLNLKSRI
jgi:hypothetical protein